MVMRLASQACCPNMLEAAIDSSNMGVQLRASVLPHWQLRALVLPHCLTALDIGALTNSLDPLLDGGADGLQGVHAVAADANQCAGGGPAHHTQHPLSRVQRL